MIAEAEPRDNPHSSVGPSNDDPPRENGSAFGRVRKALAAALGDIKLAHSVFALPFALLAAFMATPVWRASGAESIGRAEGVGTPGEGAAGATFAWQLGLIVICMFFARTWAMLVNRLADWRYDRENPRTARRAIASGRLSPRAALVVALAAAGMFIASCAGFAFVFNNPWPLILSIPVLAWIAFYSFTKRFTAWCHVFLGGALAASPIAAAIAIDPGVFVPALAPTGHAILLLAGMVLCWVAGFDVAYALQDLDFDRRTGLRSIPAALGVRGALWASRGLHALSFMALVLAVRAEPRFGIIMWAGAGLVGSALIVEHAVLARRGVAGLPMAFFTLNGFISLTLGAAGIADVAR